MTLADRIDELIAKHGSLRAAARAIDIDHGYLSRLATGDKVRPGKTILRRLGVKQVITYESLKPAIKGDTNE